MTTDLLTAREFARQASLPVRTVQGWANRGLVPEQQRIGKAWVAPRGSWERLARNPPLLGRPERLVVSDGRGGLPPSTDLLHAVQRADDDEARRQVIIDQADFLRRLPGQPWVKQGFASPEQLARALIQQCLTDDMADVQREDWIRVLSEHLPAHLR